MCTFSHSSLVSNSQYRNHIAQWTCKKCTWVTLYTNLYPLYVMLLWTYSVSTNIIQTFTAVCTTILKSSHGAGNGRLLPPVPPAHDAAKKSRTTHSREIEHRVLQQCYMYNIHNRSVVARTSGEPFTHISQYKGNTLVWCHMWMWMNLFNHAKPQSIQRQDFPSKIIEVDLLFSFFKL